MTFFGWGKKYLKWILMVGETQILVCCLYSYFSINFLPFVTGATWYEQDLENGELKEIRYSDLKNKYGNQTPKLGWYRRFALVAIPAILGLIAAFIYYAVNLVFPQIDLI